MNDAWGLIAGLACIATGASMLVMLGKKRPSRPAVPSPAKASSLVRPASQLPILSASELLQRTGSVGSLEKIRTSMGLHPQNFETDVLPLLHRFVEYVQLLPASESHHHAQPGGLLIHTLDVAAYALALRMGYKLPTGTTPEEQIRFGPVWTFAVLVAALLHDIGKPVSDVLVQVYGDDPQTGVPWNGLTGSLVQLRDLSTQTYSHYTVQFNAQRDYQDHQQLGTTLLHALVPPSALQWLGTAPGLFAELMDYLRGGREKSSILREIVSKADQMSVAQNLKSGPRTRFASARTLPLIERLMQGLRALMAENLVAVNRPGAAAFVDPDGIHIWLVAGTIADAVRKILEEREQRPKEGGAGIPSDNTRLFDTWQEYGALVAPSKEHGKGAVWWVRVEMEDWTQVLTVLKFPLDGVYAAHAPRPAALRGAIVPVSPSTRASGSDTPPPAPTSENAEHTTALLTPAHDSVAANVAGAFQESDFPDFLLPIKPPALTASALQEQEAVPETTAHPPQEPTAASGDEFLDASDDANTPQSTAPSAPVQAVQALRKTAQAPRAPFKAPGAQSRPDADRFVAWLQNGLGTGELNYNESDAVLHFVPEGLAILSPKAMKIYLETNAFVSDIGESKDTLRALQLQLQKAGYLLFNKDEKGYFHWYRTTRDDGSPGATLSTYLISNPQAYVRPVPAANPLLVRTSKPVKKSPS